MIDARLEGSSRPAVREALRWLLVLPTVAISFAMLALADNRSLAQDPLSYLADTSTGVILAIAGALYWSRRPGRWSGPLLVLSGYLWYVGSIYIVVPNNSFIPYLGFVFRGYYDVLIAFVVLAFPSDRLTRRVERIAVAGLLALMLATSAWRLVATPPGFGTGYSRSAPASPLLAVRDIALTLNVNVWLGLAVGVVLGCIGLLAIGRLRGMSPGSRSIAAPALVAGAAWAAVAAFGMIAGFSEVIVGVPLVPDDSVWRAIEYSVQIVAPIGILISVSRLRSRSAAVIEIVAGPAGAPTGDELERALRAAFDDPALALAYPTPDGWIGTDGSRVDLDDLPVARVATVVAQPDGAGVAIVHDEMLLDEPALVRTVGAVVGLAVENGRLQDDLRHQLDEVKASRARIAEAADAERQRVERDLHDGAQQRLVALLMSLRTIKSRLGPSPDPTVLDELDAAANETRAAIAEVRELAQGLDPAIVREAGLTPALRSLADRSPIPVALKSDIDVRLPARVETTAYFVVSEALTNAAKHSGATRVALTASVTGDLLALTITDDGSGGADPSGHGLRGLIDRIAAVDGEVTISSPAGEGTTIEVRIPCAS